MKYKRLRSTSLLVSEFSLETMTFGDENFPMSMAMNKQDSASRWYSFFFNNNNLFPIHVPKKGRIRECPYPVFLRVICFLLD